MQRVIPSSRMLSKNKDFRFKNPNDVCSLNRGIKYQDPELKNQRVFLESEGVMVPIAKYLQDFNFKLSVLKESDDLGLYFIKEINKENKVVELHQGSRQASIEKLFSRDCLLKASKKRREELVKHISRKV
ncbi:hypothetical protein DSO57_1009530 [Entomophthora muscae]|uniref:Uncharacterized protein n=2 Tax=Entomophthora muscae TaxID=34485 RepID=A0ACC2RLE2_9FUNG|nr:hypothetical protein DSO57_1009530 [Entomophthora muscae]